MKPEVRRRNLRDMLLFVAVFLGWKIFGPAVWRFIATNVRQWWHHGAVGDIVGAVIGVAVLAFLREKEWREDVLQTLMIGIERLMALILLVLLMPLFCVTAAAIPLTSPGPWLTKQQRIGLRGRPFTLYRFRVIDAIGLTPVGRLLRSYGLEALPQLWNVVAGDMRLMEMEGIRAH
jgi:hypothetical protein